MPATATAASRAKGGVLSGAVVGIALGGIYVASPLTLWCGGAIFGLFVWAGRGLGERERRYVWGILGVAVAVRVLAVAVLFVTSDPNVMTSFFWDGDGVYLKRRAMSILAFWSGIPVPQVLFSRAFDHGYGWSSYLYLLAYLQYLTGPAPYGGHLFNVSVFMAAAVALYRLVRSSYGRVPALLGLALMLFFPTLIAWSVSALKESLYLFLSVLGLRAAIAALRSLHLHQRLAAGLMWVCAIAVNSTVRTGAGFIMIGGIGLGLAGSFLVRRLALFIPVVVCLPLMLSSLWENPGARARIMSQITASAVQHRGAVNTPGNTYRLLDTGRYATGRALELTPDEALQFVGRALASFVAVPLPTQVVSRSELVFLPQQVLWYILVVFAGVGFVAGLRRDALVTCMLAGLAVIGAVTIALNSGNVGSLVRFRDTIVPFVVWLSALGLVSTLSQLLSRSRASKRYDRGGQWTAPTIEGAS